MAFISYPASEQPSRHSDMDAAGRPQGGLPPHPCTYSHVLPAVLWEILWTAADCIPQGIHTTEKHTHTHTNAHKCTQWSFWPATCALQYPQSTCGEAKLPGQLRVKVWFGLAADVKHFNQYAEGKVSVFAETVWSSSQPNNFLTVFLCYVSEHHSLQGILFTKELPISIIFTSKF